MSCVHVNSTALRRIGKIKRSGLPRLYLYLDTVAHAGLDPQSCRPVFALLLPLSIASFRIFEKEIGMPVFERLPHGGRFTAAGEVLIATIRRSLSGLAPAASQNGHLRGLFRGTVRIANAEQPTDPRLQRESLSDTGFEPQPEPDAESTLDFR